MYYCSFGLHALQRSLDYAQAIAFIQKSIKFRQVFATDVKFLRLE
ncbi:MAG: hypothetical protein ACR2LR_00765 [Hassallia sp.]